MASNVETLVLNMPPLDQPLQKWHLSPHAGYDPVFEQAACSQSINGRLMIQRGRINIFVLSFSPIQHGGYPAHHKESFSEHKIKFEWWILKVWVWGCALHGVRTPPSGTERGYAPGLKVGCVPRPFGEPQYCSNNATTPEVS